MVEWKGVDIKPTLGYIYTCKLYNLSLTQPLGGESLDKDYIIWLRQDRKQKGIRKKREGSQSLYSSCMMLSFSPSRNNLQINVNPTKSTEAIPCLIVTPRQRHHTIQALRQVRPSRQNVRIVKSMLVRRLTTYTNIQDDKTPTFRRRLCRRHFKPSFRTDNFRPRN